MITQGVLTYSSSAPVEKIGDFERNVPFSVEAWIYQTTMKSGSIAGKMGEAPLLRGWLFQTWTGRNVGLSLCNDNGGNYVNVRTGSSMFSFNTWAHVVATYNGSSLGSGIKIYVNGVSKTVSIIGNTLTGTILNDNKLWIGFSNVYGGFPGRLDEVVIYDRVLSSSEISQRYNAGAGIENLIGSAYLQYHLNETSGSSVSDSSGNNRNSITVDNPSWIAGKLNNCLQVNGSSQYIEAVS